MPTLYCARGGSEVQPNARVTLTFRELRWMFGAYEPRYLSAKWPQSEIETSSRVSERLLIEVSERDGGSGHFAEAGFYLLAGLSTAKVDELLKHRESYAQRLDGAELWEIGQRRLPGRTRVP